MIKELNEQIKNLKGQIDAHIIEESDLSQSMKELKEKKVKEKNIRFLMIFFLFFLEALEEQLLPNEQKN
jgi:hypothetical protein